jgi:flagellar hook assembly protein FlgD
MKATKAQAVRLTIYNTAGQRVFNIIRDISSASPFKYRWQGINDVGLPLPTGVYFLQIEQNGLSAVKKLTIIK